jgi:hypothetical protein
MDCDQAMLLPPMTFAVFLFFFFSLPLSHLVESVQRDFMMLPSSTKTASNSDGQF